MRILSVHEEKISRITSITSLGTLCACAIIVGLLCLLGSARPARAQANAKAANQSENSSQVARGKYLVESVAMCGTCHTQHDDKGQADPAHPLEGAALWLNPTMPVANWPLRAPRIGGTPPATDAQMVMLLTTGIWIDGKHLRPPMPQFRMTPEDASAVVAYLKSMSAGQ
jgi:mono/diheme cytochrome c family protein